LRRVQVQIGFAVLGAVRTEGGLVEIERRQHEIDKVEIAPSPLTNEQLLYLAFRDPLTGMLNRRGFDEELRRIWSLGQQQSFPIGLLIIDVDHFKAVNDSYGHAAGDQVLKGCAQLVQASVRSSDVVCRYYGGDELVVILPRSAEAETHEVAERMLEKFRTQIICPGSFYIQTTISIGLCHMTPKPGQTADRFLIQADRALYRAKQTGRNKICMADELIPSAEREGAGPVPVAPAGTADTRRVVLVVDDDPALCSLFHRMLAREKFDVLVAESGGAAMEIVNKQRGIIDVALVDLHLGNENGLELLNKLRGIDESMIGVVITGQATLEDAVNSLRYGAYDFVQKPVSVMQLTTVLERAIKYRRLVLENKRYQNHLEDMVREKNSALSRVLDEISDSYQFTLEAMADMLDSREQMTGAHSKRVARMSLVLAREMGMTPEEMETMETGALLHDIGKIGIPDAILLKQSTLTDEEREIMQKHPHIGYNIIKAGPGLEPASEIVLEHHERFDGNGYPRGLKGEQICLGARIFAVVDTYDAIRSERSYKKGRSAQEARDEILRNKGTQFDPAVVEALQRCQAEIEHVGSWPAP
jgi:diguanylate cyclase (GGDEF)-like protein/putative nucleotidyltransferase with HDIG domain